MQIEQFFSREETTIFSCPGLDSSISVIWIQVYSTPPTVKGVSKEITIPGDRSSGVDAGVLFMTVSEL